MYLVGYFLFLVKVSPGANVGNKFLFLSAVLIVLRPEYYFCTNNL